MLVLGPPNHARLLALINLFRIDVGVKVERIPDQLTESLLLLGVEQGIEKLVVLLAERLVLLRGRLRVAHIDAIHLLALLLGEGVKLRCLIGGQVELLGNLSIIESTKALGLHMQLAKALHLVGIENALGRVQHLTVEIIAAKNGAEVVLVAGRAESF